MIVVLGRPGLSTTWRSDVARSDQPDAGLAGRAALVALAAREAGADVELVGSVGDDPEGDEVIVRLGRAHVGHAAVLRDPAGCTPDRATLSGRSPRLDAADISLGLSYITDCRVLVIAEALSADAQVVAGEAAAYHGAAVIAVVESGGVPASGFPPEATLLQAPESEGSDAPEAAAQARADSGSEDDQREARAAARDRSDAFIRLIARYAVALDRDEEPEAAFRAARQSAGWERIRE